MVSLHHPSALATGPRPGARETIALLAALMALNAIAIDSMIPALEDIASHLGVDDENRRQLVFIAYTLGFGVGQLFWGPLADRFGRKPTLMVGIAIYVVLAFRLLGRTDIRDADPRPRVPGRRRRRDAGDRAGHGPRPVRGRSDGPRDEPGRDGLHGRAGHWPPASGQLILTVGPWQAIFWALGGYGVLLGIVGAAAHPRDASPEHRRSLRMSELLDGARAVLTDRQSLGYTLAQTALFSGLIAYIASIQQIVFDVFKRPDLIGIVFGAVAAPMALASFTNSRLVGRLGLRRVAHIGVVAFALLALGHAGIATFLGEGLAGFVIGQALVLASFSFCAANMNTLAMERMAPVAGMASSIQGVISAPCSPHWPVLRSASRSTERRSLICGGWRCAVRRGWSLVLLTDPQRLFERLQPAA